ncbi:MAG: hypothetical protein KDD10_12830, partial [Phaeodactylibacter sp.]|nr:hypothetical protein [Phaeodactylibacter sp.]
MKKRVHPYLSLRVVFFMALTAISVSGFGQYSQTVCKTVADLIATDRNDFAHATQPIPNEGYLHNFNPPMIPCGLNNPSLTSLVVSINITDITASADCTGIPIFGNVLVGCPLTTTAVCPIIQDVLTPGCGGFGGGATAPGGFSLDLIGCGNAIGIGDIIGVDLIPATDFSPTCPSNGSAISGGLASVSYEICLTYVYNQDLPPSCTNTIDLPCNDGDPCTTNDVRTVEACDNSIVCVPCAGTFTSTCTNTVDLPCNDGDPCTLNDVQTVEACDNSIVCVPCAGTPAPNCTNVVDLPCNDGDPCTINDVQTVESCDNSIVCVPCAGTPVPSCTNTVDLPCNDGNPCTINDVQTVEACDNSIVC